MGPIFGGWEALAQAVNFVISFAMVSVLFAMICKIMPRLQIAWRDVWTGAIVTALLFTVGKFAIGLYVGKSGVVGIFPNDAAVTRLVSAMLLEQNDEWSLNRRYMQLEGLQTLSDTALTRLPAVQR